MKIKLSTSEVYPVYSGYSGSGTGTEVEIDEDLWKSYLAAKSEFYDLLDQVEEIVLSQRGRLNYSSKNRP